MRRLIIALVFLSFCSVAGAQQTVSFPTEDGGVIFADQYGNGARCVVLAHGGQFNKESWKPQAEIFAKAGFGVLAIDFRGFGKSYGPSDKDFYHAPFQLDILAAVRYLKARGAQTIDVVGGSFGGAAAGDASIASRPGEIEKIVMLGGAPNGPAERLHSASLFLVARNDANDDGLRLPAIQAQYEKAPQPKKLVVLGGSAHAQFLFQTDQGGRVMQEILAFLNSKDPH